jgi:hypothetical protein
LFVSSDFGEALLENWQSEFMQFSFFIFATVWLVQRGSNEPQPHNSTTLQTRRIVMTFACLWPVEAIVGGRVHVHEVARAGPLLAIGRLARRALPP